MKRFTVLAVLLLTMLFLAGTVSAQMTGAGWANSNRSGEVAIVHDGGALLRNVPGQLTHTAFQLNTNSCASCHMTHTAVGSNLLIQATTQATCMACHDGTIGFLDVEALPGGTLNNAGMGGSVAAGSFGVVEGTRTASMHNVLGTGGISLSGAPGGNRTGITEQAGASWTENFTCASCHAPHGSHSIRLLHPNPNNVALRAIPAAATGVAGGRYTVNASVYLNLNNFTTGVMSTITGNTVTEVTYNRYTLTIPAAAAAPWVAGSLHAANFAAITGAGLPTVPAGRVTQPFTRIYHSLWDPNANGFSDPTVNLGVYANNMLTRFFTINFATGQILQTTAQRSDLIARLQHAPFNLSAADAALVPLRIDVARGLQVRGRAVDTAGNLVLNARQANFLNPHAYDAPAYNLFCAACHTDYLPTISAGNQTGAGVGLYSQKFRHTINRGASGNTANVMPVTGGTGFAGANLTGNITGSNQLMCLSCHFAHGADASMMLLADNTRVSAGSGGPGSATDQLQNDVSAQLGGSSALKRYINQASCWHCHIRSSNTVFQNTSFYWQQFPSGPTW
ncbi:MAG: hypothetical protein DDT39_01481 [Firmicutes bacterium]|nr:hypothetical protein [candidate division NPL-UPA2 bacterium]